MKKTAKSRLVGALLVLIALSCPAWADEPAISIMHEEDWAGSDLTHVVHPGVPVVELSDLAAPVLKRLLFGPDADAHAVVTLSKLNFLYDQTGQLALIIYAYAYTPNTNDDEPKAFIGDLDADKFRVDYAKDRASVAISMPERLKKIKISRVLRFNDPQDVADHGRNLILGQESSVSQFLDKQIEKSGLKPGVSLRAAAVASEPIEPLDFMAHMTDFEGTSTEGHLIVLGNRIYNKFDLGNYLWGATMHRLGFSYLVTKAGSELNGFFNTRRNNGQGNGIILYGDSSKDQEAIRRGYNGYLNGGKAPTDLATQLVLPLYWQVQTH